MNQIFFITVLHKTPNLIPYYFSFISIIHIIQFVHTIRDGVRTFADVECVLLPPQAPIKQIILNLLAFSVLFNLSF